MKKLLRVLAILVVVLAMVFVLGPRVSVDQSLRPVTLPDDLDRYLAETEARFADLRPGVEKREAGREAMADVVNESDKKDALAALRLQIKKALQDNPDLATEIATMIPATAARSPARHVPTAARAAFRLRDTSATATKNVRLRWK